MSRKKRYIELSAAEVRELEKVYKGHSSHAFRKRCHCILLSHQGYTVGELAKFFQVSPISIYAWLNRWQSGGLQALQEQPGKGRKPKLSIDNATHVKQVRQLVQKTPQNLQQVKSELEERLGIEMSKRTLKRFLKNLVSDGDAFEPA